MEKEGLLFQRRRRIVRVYTHYGEIRYNEAITLIISCFWGWLLMKSCWLTIYFLVNYILLATNPSNLKYGVCLRLNYPFSSSCIEEIEVSIFACLYQKVPYAVSNSHPVRHIWDPADILCKLSNTVMELKHDIQVIWNNRGCQFLYKIFDENEQYT